MDIFHQTFDNFVVSLKVLQPLMATAGGMWALLTSCYILILTFIPTNKVYRKMLWAVADCINLEQPFRVDFYQSIPIKWDYMSHFSSRQVLPRQVLWLSVIWMAKAWQIRVTVACIRFKCLFYMSLLKAAYSVTINFFRKILFSF